MSRCSRADLASDQRLYRKNGFPHCMTAEYPNLKGRGVRDKGGHYGTAVNDAKDQPLSAYSDIKGTKFH